MSTLTLTPKLQIHQPEQSHPRLSLRRVLYVKMLRWVDKATFKQLFFAASNILLALAGVIVYLAPSFFLGYILSVLQWKNAVIPTSIAIFLTVWKMPTIVNFVQKWRRTRPRTDNQYTYHGVPIGELASFLKRHEAFKLEDAVKDLGLSQGQYSKIGKELEEAGVLTRGEKNARVLREISLPQLVMQLRDKFPLAWSPERNCWYERNGAFEEWCVSHDFKQRKLKEDIERKERKVRRLENKIENIRPLAHLFSQETVQ